MSNEGYSATAPANLWADDEAAWKGAPPRSFGEAIKVCFSKYATFSGRASRSEFWWFMLALATAGGVASFVSDVLYLIVLLGAMLPSWAVSARRLHDVNQSGWWLLLNFIPGGFLLLIYWSCKAPVEPNDHPIEG